MRTRNRFLPVFLLVLAAFTLVALTAPVANAIRRPPPAIVDAGDPDEPVPARSSVVPPSSGAVMQLAVGPFQTCSPRASVLEAEPAASVALNKGEWRLRDILFYVLFRSPVLR